MEDSELLLFSDFEIERRIRWEFTLLEEARIELSFLLVDADHSFDEDLIGNVDVFFLDVIEV